MGAKLRKRTIGMGVISNLLGRLGGKPGPAGRKIPPAAAPIAAPGRASEAQIQQALAQRRETLGAMGVDAQERLARAIQAQVARQRVDREIRDAGGSPQLQDALRRLMAER